MREHLFLWSGARQGYRVGGEVPVGIQMEKDCRVESMSLESRSKIWPRVIELE